MFVRHPRARRYLIRVTADGTVRVTVPRGGSKREAAAFAEREQAWIEKQLRRERSESNGERERRTANRARRTTVRSQRDRSARCAPARSELPPRLLELAAQHGLTVSPDQHPESALAMGILLAQRPHLPELAAGDDAGCR